MLKVIWHILEGNSSAAYTALDAIDWKWYQKRILPILNFSIRCWETLKLVPKTLILIWKELYGFYKSFKKEK